MPIKFERKVSGCHIVHLCFESLVYKAPCAEEQTQTTPSGKQRITAPKWHHRMHNCGYK